MDDDADCVEHEWALTELHPTSTGMQRAMTCRRCGAPAYDGGQAAATGRRPPLDG